MHSSMYQDLSITTVPEPLSAGLIMMLCRCLSWLMACRSEAVRLSRILLGLQVVMSSLTASNFFSQFFQRQFFLSAFYSVCGTYLLEPRFWLKKG